MSTPPNIVICTPIFGSPETSHVTLAYHRAQMNFAKDPSIGFLRLAACQSDIVRARSRMVRQFLEDPHATHLLWWDEDVAGDPQQIAACLSGMIASGHDVVAAPYPGKKVDWNAAAVSVLSGGQPEWGAYKWSYGYHSLPPVDGQPGGGVRPDMCVEVECCRGGFMLISRTCLERMVKEYEEELWFTDVVDGKPYRTVAIYMLTMSAMRIAGVATTERRLDAEDFAFCARWRKMGGSVYLYVGNGSPLNHIGMMTFRGAREGIYDGAVPESMPAMHGPGLAKT